MLEIKKHQTLSHQGFGFHHPPTNAVFSNILRCVRGAGGDEDWTLIWRNVIYAPGLRRWKRVKPSIAGLEALDCKVAIFC